MRIRLSRIITFLLVLSLMLALAGCDTLQQYISNVPSNSLTGGDDQTDDNTSNDKKIPVYQGMTVLPVYESTYSGSNGEGNNNNDNNGNHYGHYKGDHTGKDDEFDKEDPFPDNENDENIEEEIKSSLVVQGAEKDLYYASSNEYVYINVHINNPDMFEILSFTLNGEKYSSYMFEEGSTLEKLVLKYNVGDVGGIVDYTIDAIKYVDGTEIKDVIIAGDKTVQVGVRNDDQVVANVNLVVTTTRIIELDVNITDKYNLVEYFGGEFKAVLYNGDEIIAIQDVTKGDNKVVFDGLTTNTLYQYAIVACYDDLSGDGFGTYVVNKNAVRTDAVVLFDNVTVNEDSASFTLLWNEKYTAELTAIKLFENDELVRELLLDATVIDSLVSQRSYTVIAEYNYEGKTESIKLEIATGKYTVPDFEISDFSHTNTSVSFGITETDEGNIGCISKIELYKDGELFIADDVNVREFIDIPCDSEYLLKITYEYDLNEGDGIVTIEKTKSFTTLHEHEWQEADCLTAKNCATCGDIEGEALGHTGGITNCYTELATCERCGKPYSKLDQHFYLDGSNLNGMLVETYAENSGLVLPEITDGYYSLINQSTGSNEWRIWIESEENKLIGLSHKNSPIGILSFKFKSVSNSSTSFLFHDSSTLTPGSNRMVLGCFSSEFMTINHYVNSKNGQSTISIQYYVGASMWETKTFTLENGKKCTDWIDVKICITSYDNGRFGLHYFVNGEYVGYGPLTAPYITNSFNNVMIGGSTEELGGGIMLDDIIFGYSPNEEWNIEDHIHTGGTATCYDPATCERCNQKYGGLAHEWIDATCTTPRMCTLCEMTEGEVLAHNWIAATCDSPMTCSVGGETVGDPLEHIWIEANCTTPTTCSLCSKTTGYALNHDFGDNSCGEAATCLREGCGYYTESIPHDWGSYMCNGTKSCQRDGCSATEFATHRLALEFVSDIPTYVCEICENKFELTNSYYFDGTNYENMTVNGNGYTSETNDLGQYEFILNQNIKNNEFAGQLQLWIPSGQIGIDGFNTSNNATGSLSFKFNSSMNNEDYPLNLRFVDNSSGGALDLDNDGVEESIRWSELWCIKGSFFKISAPDDNGFVHVMGWDDVVLKSIATDEN